MVWAELGLPLERHLNNKQMKTQKSHTHNCWSLAHYGVRAVAPGHRDRLKAFRVIYFRVKLLLIPNIAIPVRRVGQPAAHI